MIRVQEEDFDIAYEMRALQMADVGAVVTFTGLVREQSPLGVVSAIELECYPGMTEKSLAAIEAEAWKRWPLQGITIVHRIGHLEAGQQIVLVAVSASHRQAAFEAATFLMDCLKTRALFWKKEWVDGQAHWVEQKLADVFAAERW